MQLISQKPRLSQVYLTRAFENEFQIRQRVRIRSVQLTTACNHAGMPAELAETLGGLLATVLEDLMMIGRLRKSDVERSIRMEAVLELTREPYASGLKIAIACSPVNGRAAARHWDAICEKHELGKFAWLLNMDTETAYKYSKKVEKRS